MSVNRESESILRAHLNWNILLTCPPMIIHAECARCPWGGVSGVHRAAAGGDVNYWGDGHLLHPHRLLRLPTHWRWVIPATDRKGRKTNLLERKTKSCLWILFSAHFPRSFRVSVNKETCNKTVSKSRGKKAGDNFHLCFQKSHFKAGNVWPFITLANEAGHDRTTGVLLVYCVRFRLLFFFRERNTLVLLKGKEKELENWT